MQLGEKQIFDGIFSTIAPSLVPSRESPPFSAVANVIATFKMIQKPPKLQQKLDSFVQQRET